MGEIGRTRQLIENGFPALETAAHAVGVYRIEELGPDGQ